MFVCPPGNRQQVPSPDLLAEIITLYGGRLDPTHTGACFALRNCRATVSAAAESSEVVPVRIVALGFRGAELSSDRELSPGSALVLEFCDRTIGRHPWHCRVERTLAGNGRGFQMTVVFGHHASPAESGPIVNTEDCSSGQ